MSRTNETRHINWHKTCKCKCTLDASVCNNKRCWNNDKCWCECKELIDKGTQPAGDVPGTSPEGPLKVLTSGTPGELQGTLRGPAKKLTI